MITSPTETVNSSTSSHVVQSAPRVIDGVARQKSQRTAPKHTKKQVQKSSTLMRKAVKKPDVTQKTVQKNVAGITKSQLGTHPRRAAMASSSQKSPHIQKYGDVSQRTSVRMSKIAELPVKEPVVSESVQHATRTPETTRQTTTKNAAHAIIDSALHNAQSHNQPLHPDHEPKKKRLHHKFGVSKKVMQFATGGLAALLLVGFFALQNVPNLSMRVAAARSGVNSSMPGYTPSGFAYSGPINYSDGVVTVSFNSTSDEREYSITQQKSSWNSDTLLNEFVATSTEQYQTYLDGRGRTLYIYNKNNATWVQDGVWYKVEGDSKLTTDQLARLAASM